MVGSKLCPRCGPDARWVGEFCDRCLTWSCVPADPPEEQAALRRALQSLHQQAQQDGWSGQKPDTSQLPGKWEEAKRRSRCFPTMQEF